MKKILDSDFLMDPSTGGEYWNNFEIIQMVESHTLCPADAVRCYYMHRMMQYIGVW